MDFNLFLFSWEILLLVSLGGIVLFFDSPLNGPGCGCNAMLFV